MLKSLLHFTILILIFLTNVLFSYLAGHYFLSKLTFIPSLSTTNTVITLACWIVLLYSFSELSKTRKFYKFFVDFIYIVLFIYQIAIITYLTSGFFERVSATAIIISFALSLFLTIIGVALEPDSTENKSKLP